MSIEWRTRKRGSPRQIGKRFPVYPRPDKSSLPKALKIVSKPRALDYYSEEELLEAGIEELRDRGLELGIDYEFTDSNEITVRTVKRTPREPDKSPDEEVDWVEHQRRLAEFKKTKGLSSVR